MALSGWIKVHRALSDHLIASDPATLSVWMHLLLLANHKESKRLINGRVLVLKPGQLITSRKSLAAKTGVQESKIERIISRLKNEHQIEQQGTTKFRVISIVNWAEYQIDEQQPEQVFEQQMNTLEEVSNDTKNKKQDQKTPSKPVLTEPMIGFDAFWKSYPRKVGKQDAVKAWKKINPDMFMLDSISAALEKAKNSPGWIKDSGQFIPHPASWLNGHRWEDDIDDFTDLPYDQIAESYNEICGKLFKACEGMPVERKLRVRNLAREQWRGKTPFIEQGLPFWRKFFTACAQSKNWAGQNAEGRIASFDTVIKNAATVLEGVRA